MSRSDVPREPCLSEGQTDLVLLLGLVRCLHTGIYLPSGNNFQGSLSAENTWFTLSQEVLRASSVSAFPLPASMGPELDTSAFPPLALV